MNGKEQELIVNKKNCDETEFCISRGFDATWFIKYNYDLQN